MTTSREQREQDIRMSLAHSQGLSMSERTRQIQSLYTGKHSYIHTDRQTYNDTYIYNHIYILIHFETNMS